MKPYPLSSLASGALWRIELGLVVTALALQFWGTWETWRYFDVAQLFTLHLIAVTLSMAQSRDTVLSAPHFRAVLTFRLVLLGADALVISRASQSLHDDSAAATTLRLVFAVALFVCSAVRIVVLWPGATGATHIPLPVNPTAASRVPGDIGKFPLFV